MDVKHFILSHIPWLVLVVCALVGFHYWLAEHDARLAAQVVIAKDEAQVKQLQTQIEDTNKQIATLQQSMKDVNAAAQKQVQVIVKQQEQVKTPQQAIAQIDSVSSRPLVPLTMPDAPDRASVLAIPLFQELSQCRVSAINLDACTHNLASETKIAEANDSNYQKQVAITAQKDDEIKALKKPKGFWKQLGHDLKIGLVWAAGGALLVHGI